MFLISASLFGKALSLSHKPADAAAQCAVVAFNIDRVNISKRGVAKDFSSVLVNKLSSINYLNELPVNKAVFPVMVQKRWNILWVAIAVNFQFLGECRNFKNCAHLPDEMIGNHVNSFTDGVSHM